MDDFTDLPEADSKRWMPSWFYVLLCQSCGFWCGRLHNELGFVDLDLGIRGSLRRVSLDSESISPKRIISYLHENQAMLNRISPFKAEEVVAEILSDAFDAEVRHFGGRQDKGVDGYVVMNDVVASIIQVKWRRDSKKAEGVQVVRELAGTMLARGIPSGLIVTTRTHMSRAALSEIEEINKREIFGAGKINMAYATYKDILAMLELSSRRLSEKPELPLDIEALDIDTLFELEGAVVSESAAESVRVKQRDTELLLRLVTEG